jgi:hypothetical protein
MNIKLGFCNSPEPIYLYIKKEEIDGKSCLWYQFDHDNNKQIPVESKAIAGYLQDIRITVKEFKDKENAKLELVVNADENYVLRSGIETNFSKSILLALSQVSDFSKPLIFAVLAGNENVVFGRLYNAETKQRISAEWNPNADFYGLINRIEDALAIHKTHEPDQYNLTLRGESVPSLPKETNPGGKLLEAVGDDGQTAFAQTASEGEARSFPESSVRQTSPKRTISEAQQKRFWAIAKGELKLSDEAAKIAQKHFGFDHAAQISVENYDAVIEYLHLLARLENSRGCVSLGANPTTCTHA